ncbi:hypothetical protein JCM12298_30790 [Desulfothermus naphthae]
MHGYLPYEITKSVETVISDPELAKKVIEAIEKGLYSIEEKAKEQKVIIKTELKDELTKELVTKDELKATEERLRKEMEEIRGEIKATEEKLRGEIKAIEGKVRGEIKATEEKLRTEIHKWRADTIKWMFIFWLGQIATFTGILVSVLKLMLK